MKFIQEIPKEKLQKIILVCIIGVTITAGVIIFYLNNQLNAIRKTDTQLANVQQQISEAEKQNKANRQLELQRDDITKFAADQRLTFVVGDPLSWTVRAIGDMAAKHPVRILGWRPGNKESNRINSRYEAFSIHLEVDGDYDSLGRFIEAIENTFPASEIRRVEFMAPNPSEPSRRVNLDISLPILPESQRPKTPNGNPSTEASKPV